MNHESRMETPSLAGKTCVVTGGTAGLGKQTVLSLAAKHAANVVFTGRNAKRAQEVIDEVKASYPDSEVSFVPCDLTSLAAVRKAAQDITIKLIQLDILTCNAGTMATPPSLSTDGYETQFATNHLGHAQLDQSLLPFLERTAASQGDARIVCLSSLGYQLVNSNDFATLNTTQNNRFFASWIRYGQSKLANMLYAHQLAAKHPELSVISVHPGVIAINLVGTLGYVDRAIVYATDIGRMVTAEQGAMNSVWAASVEKKDLTNGGLRASWQGG